MNREGVFLLSNARIQDISPNRVYKANIPLILSISFE